MSLLSYASALYIPTMSFEIERKFLVIGDYKTDAYQSFRISQGYLNRHPARTVRIRIKGNQGFITVKGSGSNSGTTRFEWEKEIPLNDAVQLLQLCEPGVIDKTRYLVKVGNHTFEVDEFMGDNEGLVMAEIELADENEAFERPAWLGNEVTGNPAYYNAALSNKPFKTWT